MLRVQPVSVHIAVLSVAKDPRHPDHNAIATAVERATGAGHQVVEQATVKDSEPAVREQLTRWITDSNIDVVLVLGAESDTASSALKPLVSSVLPGFTDLFRWLAFEEIGASAMLSQAEAALCGQAYVFVLPGAVRAAMEKLILPQLDPKTTPKNLVSSMSRLQARTAEAVPTAIHGEKTQGGAGLPPKLPAMPSVPTRRQTKTGANVIPRHRAVDDPPTKPIDLERLQKEIARSEASDQQTRKTDLAKLLPRLPPGADEYLEPDADEDLTDAELLASPPPPGVRGPKKPQSAAERARHEAATPPSPTPIVVPPAALRPTVPAVIPPITHGPRRPPTQPPPAQRPASSPTTAGGIPPRAPAQIPSIAKPPATSPLPSIAKPASAGASALAAAWSTADASGDKGSPPAEARTSTRASTEPRNGGLWIDGKTTPVEPRPAASSSVPNALAVDTKTMPIARVATPVAGTPAREIVGRPLATPAAGTPAREIAAKSAVTPPAGTRTAAGTRDVAASPDRPAKAPVEDRVETPSKTPTTELDPADLREDSIEEIEPPSTTAPAPVAAAAPSQRIPRQPTPPAMPAVRTRPPTPPPMPAVRTRPPTPPPMPAVKIPEPEPIVADAPSPRTSASDLPRGTFTYPVQRKKSGLGLKLLALACAAGLGFVAVVYLLPMIMGTQEPAQATTAQVESPPAPAVETAPVETAPVETPPIETPPIDTPPIDTPPIDTPPPTETPVATPAQQPTQRSTERPAQRSSHASKPAGEPTPRSETKAEPKPVAKPAVEEPVVDDGCDETSCILSKYEKACCEKYKPKTSDLSARTGGGLPEELDKMMVRAGVEKVKPRVVACGEKAAAKGTVRIAMSVSPAGAVTSAEVAETPDAGLGACVLAAMKAASFGKSVNGGTFTYPFAF